MSYVYLLDLTFTETTHTALFALYQQLVNAKIGSATTRPEYYPHVTLLGVTDIYKAEAHREVVAFTRNTQPFAISLSHVGIFATEESVVYLGVTPTLALLQLQRDFARQMSPVIEEVWAYFSEGTWVPHCTLVQYIPASDFGIVIEATRTLNLPITARVESLSVVKITATGAELVERLPLGDV